MLIKWYELTKDEFAQHRDSAVVAVNFASIEQHAPHLPVGTDVFLGERVLLEGARRAKRAVLVLPTVCYGYSPHHRFAPGYLTIGQNTLIAYARDICACVAEQGFGRMVIINSHGGNQSYLSCAVNEIGETYENILKLAKLNYWDLIADAVAQYRESGLGGMGHAGEFETSLMLYLYPELVRREKIFACDPPAGDRWYQRELFSNKVYMKYESFNKYNKNGNIGQPHFATVEKGRLFFEAVADALAAFLDDFGVGGPSPEQTGQER